MATIVLIHGAYQGGWIWKPTARVLRHMGHEVFSPSLDGCGERAHQLRSGITNDSHARELAELLRYEDLNEVVLVGTSSGGMVLSRTAELARDRIGRVVFADALALFNGEAISDHVTRRDPMITDTGTGPRPDDARHRLFAELEPDILEWALERTTLHPRSVMEDPIELESFWDQEWSARVIWCRNSANPPREHQQRCADKLNAQWHELDTGHYPMLQSPDALAELIAAP